MRAKYLLPAPFFILCSLYVSGCFPVDQDFMDTKEIITAEMGLGELEATTQFRVGRSLLSLASFFAAFGGGHEYRGYLGDLRSVQVSIYELPESFKFQNSQIDEELELRLAPLGYGPMVKVNSPDESVWVMTLIKGDSLAALYVIVLSGEELVLVEIRGRLERLIVKAICDHGFDAKSFMGK